MGKMQRKTKPRQGKRKLHSGGKNVSAKLSRIIEQARSLQQRGGAEAAIEFLRVECQQGKAHPHLLSMLGALEARAGFIDIGLERTKEAARKAPRNGDILANYGSVLFSAGYITDAIDVFRKSLKCQPFLQKAQYKLGDALMAGERHEEAEVIIRGYIEQFPQDLDGLGLLVETLHRANKLSAAKEICGQLIDRDPSRISSHIKYADLLISAGEIASAQRYFEQLIEAQPSIINEKMLLTQADLASVAEGPDAAINTLAEYLKTRPGARDIAKKRRDMLLSAGRFSEGWDAFSKEPGRLAKISELPHRVWRGDQSDERTLLIRGAEGIGEQLMYSQLFPMARGKIKRLVVECDERLVSIFSRSFPDIEFVRWTTPAEKCLLGTDIDLQCVPRDLGRFFLNSFDDFPGLPTNLKPSPEGISVAKDLRERYPGKRLVGISWRSIRTISNSGRKKSIPLTHWADILRTPGIQFINLQYGTTDFDIESIKNNHGIEIFDAPGIDTTNDIDQCMGLVSGLDLVITVSNVTAHYAANVGVPVWVLIDKSAHWHWFTERCDSPWYPAARLYRQEPSENWFPVLDKTVQDLSAWRQG